MKKEKFLTLRVIGKAAIAAFFAVALVRIILM